MMSTRCEGYRKKGGFMTLGPVEWIQCEKEAVVLLTVVQEETQTFPACDECWKESIETGIEITKVEPIN